MPVAVSAWVKHDTVPASIQRYITLSNIVSIRHDGPDGVGQLHFFVRGRRHVLSPATERRADRRRLESRRGNLGRRGSAVVPERRAGALSATCHRLPIGNLRQTLDPCDDKIQRSTTSAGLAAMPTVRHHGTVDLDQRNRLGRRPRHSGHEAPTCGRRTLNEYQSPRPSGDHRLPTRRGPLGSDGRVPNVTTRSSPSRTQLHRHHLAATITGPASSSTSTAPSLPAAGPRPPASTTIPTGGHRLR